jgi:flagellar hook-associated protein 3 FlgL
MEYGVQANEQAFRDIMMGMSMMASVDAVTITDPEAYKIWMSTAVDLMAKGTGGVTDIESKIGSQQNLIDQTRKAQEVRRDLYESQISDMESADPFEAATRLLQLETQLEATYQVSARMARLSFLNYF